MYSEPKTGLKNLRKHEHFDYKSQTFVLMCVSNWLLIEGGRFNVSRHARCEPSLIYASLHRHFIIATAWTQVSEPGVNIAWLLLNLQTIIKYETRALMPVLFSFEVVFLNGRKSWILFLSSFVSFYFIFVCLFEWSRTIPETNNMETIWRYYHITIISTNYLIISTMKTQNSPDAFVFHFSLTSHSNVYFTIRLQL